MTTFLALYRGATVGEAKLVAVTADPQIVADVSSRLLQVPADPEVAADPVLRTVQQGRRRALRLIRREAGEAAGVPA